MRTILILALCCSLTTGCATIRRHPYAFALGTIGTGVVVGLLIDRQPHCNHYEYGNVGVNVPCPKPDATPEISRK